MYTLATLLLLLSLSLPVRALPDLTVDRPTTLRSMFIQDRRGTDSCLVDSGCLPDMEVHRQLRFATRVNNEGDDDLDLGFPPSSTGMPECDQETVPTNGTSSYCWHTCHMHRHFMGFAKTEILYENGTCASEQAKVSFCLLDSGCFREGVRRRYRCDYQGITAGCYDVYTINVDCQWLILDGIPNDIPLTLRITVDPYNIIAESDETNNAIEVDFQIQDLLSNGGMTATRWSLTLAVVGTLLVCILEESE